MTNQERTSGDEAAKASPNGNGNGIITSADAERALEIRRRLDDQGEMIPRAAREALWQPGNAPSWLLPTIETSPTFRGLVGVTGRDLRQEVSAAATQAARLAREAMDAGGASLEAIDGPLAERMGAPRNGAHPNRKGQPEPRGDGSS
jgi:hypothetical protein